MLLRLSQRLNTKIKAGTLKALPLDENPYADWSAHLFTADWTQYIIVSNTKSLYGRPREAFEALLPEKPV